MQRTQLEERVLAAGHGRDAALERGRKKSEGIVHTPPELARLIARAADELVTRELGAPGGLADPSVALIDPACGPGAFLAAAHAVAGERVTVPGNVIGFDRDVQALARCHAAFEGVRWPLALRCEDTLHDVDPGELALLGQHVVVLGNPPWIGSAQAAASARIEALLEELRRDEDGVRLDEKKLGVLSDAYVRFLALAIAIARAARGGAVVGFVTNSSYLDGPVHRGLRGVLSRTFDAIDVIDLGGSALLAREGGTQDGNVFGVRTPAALLLAVRKPDRAEQGGAPRARVRYARLHGDVAGKLEQLGATQLGDFAFAPVTPAPPSHRFVPVRAAPPEYLRWPSLAALMPFHREGVQTNRDGAVVDASSEQLSARLLAFARGERSEAMAAAERGLSHYDPQRARQALERAIADAGGELTGVLCRIAYRPLDTRYFVPVAPLCHRPRADLLRAMRASSFALVVARKDRSAVPWRHIAASADILDNSFLSARSSCRARGVPTHDPDGAENLDRSAAAELFERAGRPLSSREVACYALALLSMPSYQAQYLAWLRADYPRVPLPQSAQAFARALRHGERLAEAWCAPVDAPLSSARAAGASDAGDGLVVGHHRVVDRQLKAKSPASAQNDRAAQPRTAALRARAALLAELLAFQPENSPF